MRWPSPRRPFSIRSGSLEGSLSLEQVYEFVNDIVPDLLTDFPHLFRTEVIGTSVEGRPIVALCLGACHAPSPAPPQALYTALHHSREPMSMMNLVFFIDHLILGLRGHDPSITALLWSRQLWFVLVVNPDGYAYNEANMPKDPDETFSGQRKNRHKSTCSETADVGVDLNRNYDVCFSQDAVGSSDEACAEDYRGPAPFSEPETRAIRDFVDRHNFSTAFNYHSFGQYFNIPFACQPKGVPPPFATSVYNALAADMTSRNRFKFGQSWKESNLYSVNGETSDWMWQAHGIFAISPETGPSFDVDNFHGFWPSDPLVIHDICNELVHSNYVLAKWAGPQYALIMQGWSTVITDDGKVAVITLDLSVRNIGLRSPHQPLQIVATVGLHGTPSSPVYTLPPLLHAADPANDAELIKLVVPLETPLSAAAPGHVYTLLRDGRTCSMFRISLGKTTSEFQVWQPLVLPQCGSCAAFGSPLSNSTPSIGGDINCMTLDASMVDVKASPPLRNFIVGSSSTEDADDIPTGRPMVAAAPKQPRGTLSVAHHEKKALLLVSLVVLLGMVVGLIGLRHVKAKQSDEYSKVSKSETLDDGEGLDNMIDMISPKCIAGQAAIENGSQLAQQRRARSPQRDDDDDELLQEHPVNRRVRSPPPPSARDDSGNYSHDEV
ncbi:hypothetical protein, variant 2 [Aphanomyces invadans]|uniref:Peptidase M14 domain-containing protein n=1 Tax=Aphanomyces invadans TaxID=157072 RepID=A0A024TNB1_9STRA|nr:hypothetical protein, variant 2 [Aphanomyces invadans]ETV95474.1 hypothetical protein, variant 2 [Aphanomyces invadans]|eukprot:XP_008875667.1 hypothetical protein, variant 2 [Aphanomyces invadans]